MISSYVFWFYKKGFFDLGAWFTVYLYRSQNTIPRQELSGRNQGGAACWLALWLTCSHAQLDFLKNSFQGYTPKTGISKVRGALLYQLTIRTTPHQHAHSHTNMIKAKNNDPVETPSPGGCRFCQVYS